MFSPNNLSDFIFPLLYLDCVGVAVRDKRMQGQLWCIIRSPVEYLAFLFPLVAAGSSHALAG